MEPAGCLVTDTALQQRVRLEIAGAVQGVGFRPFVYRLAVSEGLGGFVRNTGSGVVLEVEGTGPAVARFLERLERETRLPAVINRLDGEPLAPRGDTAFVIGPSSTEGAPSALVLPDLALCEECRTELLDPADRRHRYPFTTCMHCGPRYSIIEAMPYDRARTVMRNFAMCAACQAEYDDPCSRRFHAETNACPDCGPQLALRAADATMLAAGGAALERAVAALREGRILALKGLGGFQLVVDARNEAAVASLRMRKCRLAKPLAVMVGSIAELRVIAHASALEESLLLSPAAPIVLLRARAEGADRLALNVAPGNPLIGIMLPCTPLHHLLIAALGFPVVATSGNRSGEPIVANDAEAFAVLSGIADLFLTHNRPILRPVDDSVVRVIAGEATLLRCARGYAPLALADREQAAPLLAIGGHSKSAVAVARGGQIVLGPHVGDLGSAATRHALALSAQGMAQLHGVEPACIACDAHPDYHSTRLARGMGLPVRPVPHHLAHVLGAMIDNEIDGPVLGVAWDGAGYGRDGTIWGGEFLVVERGHYRRAAHLLPFRLPGGETALREPRRSAVGALHAVHGEAALALDDLPSIASFPPVDRKVLCTMLACGLNAPLTSSAGRLFDACAALLGLCQRASFEGEAAMAMEFAAARAASPFPLASPVLTEGDEALLVDWRPMLGGLVGAVRSGLATTEELSAGFHDWLADMIVMVARIVGIEQVVLTGGCFQNALLTERVVARLGAGGFRAFRHRRVPPNDGGLAVGQAGFAARNMKEEIGRCAWPFPARS